MGGELEALGGSTLSDKEKGKEQEEGEWKGERGGWRRLAATACACGSEFCFAGGILCARGVVAALRAGRVEDGGCGPTSACLEASVACGACAIVGTRSRTAGSSADFGAKIGLAVGVL